MQQKHGDGRSQYQDTQSANMEFDLGITYSRKSRPRQPLASTAVLGLYSSISALNPIHIHVFEAEINYRLVQRGRKPRLDCPDAICRYLGDVPLKYPVTETFWTVMLDRKGKGIARHLCSIGSLTSTISHPREVFKPAILCSAASIVVAHNHPSGDPSPSSADIHITKSLREASRALDIALLDHIILGNREDDPNAKGYYSFREAGIL